MSRLPRDLYLDLLVKSIANLIYGPRPADPWNDGLFGGNAAPGRDRNSPAHSMVGILRLRNVRDLAQRALDLGIPGDFIETGVWRGGCCILMRGVLAANQIMDRKLFFADSFRGLPPPNINEFPQDQNMMLHTMSELAIPLYVVKENFQLYELLDSQVQFIEGYFSDTLPVLNANTFALIRLDGDMYESTFVTLENLYPKLSPGGFIIIDDYGAIQECRLAVSDYRSKMHITDPMEQIDWTGVWWQKP